MVVFLIKYIFLTGFVSLAQIVEPLSGDSNPVQPFLNGVPPGGDPGVPITGGIMLLVTAALGIGIKAFSKKNKH